MSTLKGSNFTGRTIFIPTMSTGGARAVAAVFGSFGIHAAPTPPSDERTLAIGARYTSGDECYPEKITIGDALRLLEDGADPRKVAFFMPTTLGPCRFGQYSQLLRKVLNDNGYGEAMIVSPSSADGYGDIGGNPTALMRSAWRAIVSSDLVRKLLLHTRPYELSHGASDRAYAVSLDDLCAVLSKPPNKMKVQLGEMVASLTRARDRFRKIPRKDGDGILLVGVVGEIFCRLNAFSNEDVIRKLEAQGAEAWLSDISEWIWYTHSERQRKLRLADERFSMEMLKAKIKGLFMHKDEHALLLPLQDDLRGREESEIEDLMDHGRPYLPQEGAMGEMVVSIGKAVYLYEKGVDGILDISPFTCMNGIVSEAIYPRVAKRCRGLPIRNFYFDGTQCDLDRDLGIFLELCRSYQRRKARNPPHPGR